MSSGMKLPRATLSDTIPGAAAVNRWIDRIVSAIERSLNISTTGIITATVAPAGVHLHVPEFPIGIGITTGTLNPRSGTTLGTGTADLKLLALSGSNVVIAPDPARTGVTVYNFSASTPATPSGKYFVWLKIAGFYVVVSVEC